MTTNAHRKIRYGMVGGGEGAFIGAVHRMAAALDGEYALVCGAFSSDAARNQRSAAGLGLDPARAYPTLEAMIASESARPEDQRMEVLAIVTPNHLHAPAAIAATGPSGRSAIGNDGSVVPVVPARSLRRSRSYGLSCPPPIGT